MCVSSFQCAAQTNLWPSYVFYWNLFVPIKLYKVAINSLEHHTRKKKHSNKSNDTCCWKETSLSITLRQRNTHLYVIYKSQLIYIPSLCLIRWGARRGAFSFKNAREKKAETTDMSDTTTAVEATDFQEIESEYGTGEDKAAVGLQLSFNHWCHLFVTGLQAQKSFVKVPYLPQL